MPIMLASNGIIGIVFASMILLTGAFLDTRLRTYAPTVVDANAGGGALCFHSHPPLEP